VTSNPIDWRPDSRTALYAVLGHPIAHSLSPAMHNAAFRALGMNAVYLAFDVRPQDLPTVLEALPQMGCGGVNITVPLKEIAARLVPRLDDNARRAGAVNTVRFGEDGPVGFSTDAEGFRRGLREAFGADVEGRSVFVLGAGGAGRTVALECARAGAVSVTVCDVESERVGRLVAELGVVAPGVAVAGCDPLGAVAAARAATLVVQATPVGMKPGAPPPLPSGAFHDGTLAYDLVYHRPETEFMRAARSAGARAANGLGMLLWQGALAFEIWTGRAPPVEVMRTTLERAVYGE